MMQIRLVKRRIGGLSVASATNGLAIDGIINRSAAVRRRQALRLRRTRWRGLRGLTAPRCREAGIDAMNGLPCPSLALARDASQLHLSRIDPVTASDTRTTPALHAATGAPKLRQRDRPNEATGATR